MDKLAGPLFGVAFIAVVAMGLYAFTMRTELTQAKVALATVEQNRDGFKKKLDEVMTKSAGQAVALDGCNKLVRETQAKLEAATKSSGRKR